MVGYHTHVWDCLKIKIFLTGVKKEIGKIFHTDIPLDPLLFLLEFSHDHLFTTGQHYILNILLIVA